MSLCFLLFLSIAFAQSSIQPNKTVVYGPGLTKSEAGQVSLFFLQYADSTGANLTECASPAPTFSLTMDSLSVPVTYSCTDGFAIASYISKKAGVYNLTIELDGVSLGNSPYSPECFAGPIYPPSSYATGQLDGGIVGIYYNFTIYAKDFYGNVNHTCDTKQWSILVAGGPFSKTYPGRVISCNSTEGSYAAQYTAQDAGGYKMTVGINNQFIQGSPFLFDFEPASIYPANCVASGPGATSATAGAKTTFQVIAVDQFGNRVGECDNNITWTGYLLLNSTQYPVNYTGCTSGIYDFSYSVTKATTYKLYVFAGSIGIASNGNNLVVSASNIIDASQIIASGTGLTTAAAGTPAPISLTPYDVYGNQITKCVSNPNDFDITLVAKNNKSIECYGDIIGCDGATGVIQASYYCYKATVYNLYITYQNYDISGVPFTPTITAGPLNGPTTKASGEGLSIAYAGVPAYFYLDAYDQYDNKISTCQDSPTYQIEVYSAQKNIKVIGSIVNCTNGFYKGTYTITVISSYLLKIQYQGYSVDQSPYSISTKPGPPIASGCTVTGPGLTGQTAGTYGELSVSCKDTYGNPISQCYNDNWLLKLVSFDKVATVFGKAYSCNATNNGTPATTLLHYNATYAAQYSLTLSFVSSSINNLIKSSNPIITTGQPDATQTVAIGPGVDNNPQISVGVTTYYIVIARDSFGNNITDCKSFDKSKMVATFNPPVSSPPVFKNCNNGFNNYTYSNQFVGTYELDLVYSSVTIQGSPFTISFVAGPLFGSSIVAQGSGLYNAIAGINATFTLSGYDQYGNPVLACSTKAAKDFVISLSGPQQLQGTITGCNNGVYYAQYRAVITGKYKMDVTYTGIPIKASPFSPVVSAGAVSDSSSYATGNGFGDSGPQKVGDSVYVDIHAVDSFGNTIYTCNLAFNYWTVRVYGNGVNLITNQNTCSNGTYTLSYVNTVTGNFNVSASGKLSAVSNSPKVITFTPGDISSDNTYVVPFSGKTAGETVTFPIYSVDQYGNNITTCPTATNYSDWSVFGVSSNNRYNGSVVSCQNGVFTATITIPVEGTVTIYVKYDGDDVKSSPFNTYFNFGIVTAKNSRASGLGVNATTDLNVAGQWTYFHVQTYNQFNVPILNNAVCNQNINFTFAFTPFFSYDTNETVYQAGCFSGAFFFEYLPTVAGYLNIEIQLNNVDIYGNVYQVHVLPGPIDVNQTAVVLNATLPAPDTSTFGLQTKDIYGNNLVNTSSDFQVQFSPFCANTTILPTGNVQNGIIEYNYTVQFGGQYCIIIYYNGTTIQVPDTYLVIAGGLECDNHCSNQGYCFPNYSPSTSDRNASCSCFQGWVGEDCSVEMSSEYPLTVGAIVGLVIGLAILMFIIGLLLGYCIAKKMKHHHHDETPLLHDH